MQIWRWCNNDIGNKNTSSEKVSLFQSKISIGLATEYGMPIGERQALL